MRLDFNVLWVDDQPKGIASQITAIKNRMKEEGFKFNETLCRNAGQLLERISDSVFNDQIDLIMVDWDLGRSDDGKATRGQSVIADIRDSIRYKEVIFYSAADNPTELRNLAAEAGLEGVYCAGRRTLVDEVMGVFDSLVKKVLDLDHTRGIVMGSTSDIDQIVLECVTALHEHMEVSDRSELIQDALEVIQERINQHAETLLALQGDPSLPALVKAHHLFTANDRLRVLVRALKQNTFKKHGQARKSVIAYMESVVPRRNDLGHKVLLPDGKTMAISAIGGEKHFSEDQMRDLRKTILGIREEFHSLRDALRRS